MRLILCGGGHVSHALAPIALALDFDLHVIDDRPEFADPGRFPGCAVHCGPFEDVLDGLDGREEDFYCVLTRGHRYDLECVARILQKPFAYLGMMGSRGKVAATLDALRAEGFSDEALSRLHAPIGLKVGGQTPAEIAVEIAAELIQVRSELTAGQALAHPPKGPGMLCVIVEKSGSAPRGAGAWMLVAPDGGLIGTVGGGAVEWQVAQDALALYAAGAQEAERSYGLGGGGSLDMACGGNITVKFRRQ